MASRTPETDGSEYSPTPERPVRASASQAASAPEGNARRKSGSAAKFTLKPSKRTCLVLSCLIGTGFLGSAGLYAWQSGEQAKLEKQVAAKREQVASGQKIAGRLVATEAAYDDTQRQLRTLETSVTAGEYVPTLLGQMEGLAKSMRLQVGAVRPSLEPAPLPPKDPEARKKFVPWPYDKIHIEMEVRGAYWDVARLLHRLTEFPKILAVEALQVQPVPNAQPGTGSQLAVNLKLTGFIFPDDGKAAKQDSQSPGLQGALRSLGDSAQAAVPSAPPVVGKIGTHAAQGTSVVDAPPTAAPAPRSRHEETR